MLLLICSLSLLSILKYIVNEKLEVRLDENYSPCQVGSDFAYTEQLIMCMPIGET